MKATLGRIVHFISRESGNTRAAIIVGLRASPEGEDYVSLHVFADGGSDWYESPVPFSSDPTEVGCWSWPPRDPPEVDDRRQTLGDLLTSEVMESSTVTVAPDMPEPLPNVGASAADGGGGELDPARDPKP